MYMCIIHTYIYFFYLSVFIIYNGHFTTAQDEHNPAYHTHCRCVQCCWHIGLGVLVSAAAFTFQVTYIDTIIHWLWSRESTTTPTSVIMV